MQTFIIILTTVVCTLSWVVAIWTIFDARKRYPKKPKDVPGEFTVLAIRLPKQMGIRLENLAKRTGRNKCTHARRAIRSYLDDIDDLYLAEQVVRRIERGEESTSSLADVEARLGPAD